MRTVKRTHLKVFMFISLCLASMRTKSAYALGSVALALLGLGLSTGTGWGCDLEPLNALNPGSWPWPAQLQRGDKVRLGGFQLLSEATWAALPPPPSFLSPESGLPGYGRATTPAPCSGMGQVEASPHGGCCQDSAYTCAQICKWPWKRGLSPSFFPVPRLRKAPEWCAHAPTVMYTQPPGRALHESLQSRSYMRRT